MEAKDLYHLILNSFGNVQEKIVCELHKPCIRNKGCTHLPSGSYIDFDAVETEFHRGCQSQPSVDAIGYAGKYFCFIEIKGWKEYLHWNKPSVDDINMQAEYDLKGKFDNSEKICKSLSNSIDVFSEIPEVFILVTDIDINKNAVENIHSNLLALAMSASDWECECNVALQNQLNIQITAVPKYYVNCKELSVTLYKIGLG